MALYNPPISIPRSTATAISAVTNSLSSTPSVLAAANTNRKGLTIFNTLNQTVFVDSVNTVSATSYMVAVPPGAYYELPASDLLYTGVLHGFIASGTGSVQVREFS